jgi:hypothetical protein
LSITATLLKSIIQQRFLIFLQIIRFVGLKLNFKAIKRQHHFEGKSIINNQQFWRINSLSIRRIVSDTAQLWSPPTWPSLGRLLSLLEGRTLWQRVWWIIHFTMQIPPDPVLLSFTGLQDKGGHVAERLFVLNDQHHCRRFRCGNILGYFGQFCEAITKSSGAWPHSVSPWSFQLGLLLSCLHLLPMVPHGGSFKPVTASWAWGGWLTPPPRPCSLLILSLLVTSTAAGGLRPPQLGGNVWAYRATWFPAGALWEPAAGLPVIQPTQHRQVQACHQSCCPTAWERHQQL